MQFFKSPTYDYIRGYFAISSIHGFNHIVSKNTHAFEKIVWVILVSAAVYGGFALSNITLNRYYTNPVVISMETDRFSWTTPLAAVTICPATRINETALDEYLETAVSQNKTILRKFLVSLAHANYSNFENVLENEDILSEDYATILEKIKFNLIFGIQVSDLELNLTTWILETITEVGICYSFNSPLAIYSTYRYWKNNNRKLISQIQNLEIHPLDGEVYATILFNISTDCMIYIHGPYEVIDLKSKPIYKSALNNVNLYLTAISITSSEDTKQLSVSQRKCRFYYESNLLHFPIYTSVVCRMECRIFLAKKLCGCVPHFYHTLAGETTCNVTGLHCLAKHKDRLVLLLDECKCTANCEEVHYTVQERKSTSFLLAYPSILQYGIKKFPDMRLKRDVIFGVSDLLVYIGGVMGLFLGFSLLSSVEFIYYFTLRFFWVFIKKYRK